MTEPLYEIRQPTVDVRELVDRAFLPVASYHCLLHCYRQLLLDSKQGGCYRTNEALGVAIGARKRVAMRAVLVLRKLGLVRELARGASRRVLEVYATADPKVARALTQVRLGEIRINVHTGQVLHVQTGREVDYRELLREQGVLQDTLGGGQGVLQDTQGVFQDTQGVFQDTQGVFQDTLPFAASDMAAMGYVKLAGTDGGVGEKRDIGTSQEVVKNNNEEVLYPENFAPPAEGGKPAKKKRAPSGVTLETLPTDAWRSVVEEVVQYGNELFAQDHDPFILERYKVVRRAIKDWHFTPEQLKGCLRIAKVEPWYRDRRITDCIQLLRHLGKVQQWVVMDARGERPQLHGKERLEAQRMQLDMVNHGGEMVGVRF